MVVWAADMAEDGDGSLQLLTMVDGCFPNPEEDD